MLFDRLPAFPVALPSDELALLAKLAGCEWPTNQEIELEDRAAARRLERRGLIKISRQKMDPVAIETAPKDGSYLLLRFDGPFHDSECPGVSIGKAIHGGGWWLTAIWAASVAQHNPIAWMPIAAAIRGGAV